MVIEKTCLCGKKFSTRREEQKFCTPTCANEPKKYHFSSDELQNATLNSKCISEIGAKLGIKSARSSVVRRLFHEHNLEIPFLPQCQRISPHILLTKRTGKKGDLRTALLRLGRLYRCSICDLEPIWCNKKLVLQVDHIDGDSTNHVPENLRFLCPNCHSQTDTFSWKNAVRKKKTL